jgi:hypothetical protein
MSRTYMVGYAGQRMTEAELNAWQPWLRMSPEFRRRFKNLMDFCADSGKDLGPGGTWRSPKQQEALFRSRYHVEDDNNLTGSVYWDGQYWELNPGAAPAAPPLRSYHEPVEPDGSCLAVDAVGDVLFADQHSEKFGLRHFNYGPKPEPWHFQPSDIPASRSNYVKALHYPLKTFGQTPPPVVVPPAPPALPVAPKATQFLKLPVNMTGPEIFKLQSVMKMFGWYGGNADGWFGQMTEAAVRAMQKALGLTVDGVYGPKSEAGLLKFLIAMQALAK